MQTYKLWNNHSPVFGSGADRSGRMCGNSITSRIDCLCLLCFPVSTALVDAIVASSIPWQFDILPRMSTNLDQLTAEAMKLPLRDRVQLAQRLVSTLDDEIETDTEALWFAEAERRLEEFRGGKVQGIDAEDAFRTAQESLKR
jgi:putative addiction module component (TIGR02574 family)